MTGRRDTVLASLREAGRAGVSGETLAEEMGVSRAAVGKHISALRRLGYGIDARPGVGYILAYVPDVPLPEEVAPRLATDLWVRVEGGARTGSTNEDAKRLAREGACEGTVVLAGSQTAGKGRLGRTWDSPVGGVYLSGVLRPGCPIAEVTPLPLVVSLGVARGLEALGFVPALKWPNDVWLAGGSGDAPSGKVAGVLLETSAEADRVEWVVAGVGLNVRRPTGARLEPAYLDDVGPVALAEAAAAVLDDIAEAYRVWRVEGFGGLVAEYWERSMLAGTDVTVRDMDGSVRACGRPLTVDSSGRLLLDTGTGTEAVSAGDVTLKGVSP